MLSHTAAIVAAIALGFVIFFQLLLAAGLPLGRAAWGGQHAILPARLRAGSLAAAIVLGVALWVVLARAGLFIPGAGSTPVRVATWVFAGFLLLNTLGNLASKSRVERVVMTPASLLLLVCFIIIARS